MQSSLFKPTATVLAAALAWPGIGAAYDLPAVNLGLTSFLDGGPPAGPGWYFSEYLNFYEGGKLKDGQGNSLILPTPNGFREHEVDAFAALSQLIYQSDTPVLAGGKWGINAILPVVDPQVSPDDSLAIRANGSGLGDILVGPFLQWDPIMGPQGPIFMHRVEFQFILPTGKYDSDHEVNPGSNFFSFSPYWAGTYFFRPDLTASWRLHYLWNATNEDPSSGTRAAIQMAHPDLRVEDLQAGQAVHLNFAADYAVIPNQFRVGINGYWLKQITDSEADGQKLGDRTEQVFGIGPGAVWHMSKDTHLFANVYFETDAENRPEGTRLNLRLVHHF